MPMLSPMLLPLPMLSPLPTPSQCHRRCQCQCCAFLFFFFSFFFSFFLLMCSHLDWQCCPPPSTSTQPKWASPQVCQFFFSAMLCTYDSHPHSLGLQRRRGSTLTPHCQHMNMVPLAMEVASDPGLSSPWCAHVSHWTVQQWQWWHFGFTSTIMVCFLFISHVSLLIICASVYGMFFFGSAVLTRIVTVVATMSWSLLQLLLHHDGYCKPL